MENKALLLLILAVLTATSTGHEINSVHVGTRNVISDAVEKFLNDFFSNETSFQIPQIVLGYNGLSSFKNVQIDIKDAIVDPVEGTGSFSIKNLTISSKNVTASGLYRRFRLPLNFIAPGLELSEEMDFRIELESVLLSTGVTIQFNHSESTYLVIKGFPDFKLSIEKSEVWFDHLGEGPPVGNSENAILGFGIPALVEAYHKEFIIKHGEEIADFLNPIINCFRDNDVNPLECLEEQ